MWLLKRFEFNWEIILILLRYWVSKVNIMYMYCIFILCLVLIKRFYLNFNIFCIIVFLNMFGIFFVRFWKENNMGKIIIYVYVIWKKIINSIWENLKYK